MVRTAGNGQRRDLAEVADQVAAYQAAGCQIAIIEATAAHRGEARAEIDRLTAAFQPLAGCQRAAAPR